MLIGYSNHDQMVFIVDVEKMFIEVENIYFMIGLSPTGEVVNLWGGNHIEGALSIQEYIDIYCEDNEKVASNIPIARIQDHALCTIMFTILWLSGSETPHFTTHIVMYYGVTCMNPMVFDWCIVVLDTIRENLIGCRIGRLNNFRYKILIFYFIFLEDS